MASRTYRKISSEVESSFELDFSPMLSLMVTLIPIMLLSTVFVRVAVIESKIPQAVQNAVDEDRNKKDRDVSFQLRVKQDGYSVEVTKDGKVVGKKFISKNGDKWNLSSLHDEAVKLKVEYPHIFRMDLIPDKNIPYEDIVQAMDEVRNSNKNDPKIYVLDKESNQRVETTIMFPDVIFSNVLEG